MTDELEGVAEEVVAFNDDRTPVLLADEPNQDVREAIAEARADVAAGRVISHAAMRPWLLSWETDKELPPPECDGG